MSTLFKKVPSAQITKHEAEKQVEDLFNNSRLEYYEIAETIERVNAIIDKIEEPVPKPTPVKSLAKIKTFDSGSIHEYSDFDQQVNDFLAGVKVLNIITSSNEYGYQVTVVYN